MTIFKQIEVGGFVDGKQACEYNDPANDHDQAAGKEEDAIIEKHVESNTGSNFEVMTKLNPGSLFSKHK